MLTPCASNPARIIVPTHKIIFRQEFATMTFPTETRHPPPPSPTRLLLDRLLDTTIQPGDKGMPPNATDLRLRDVGRQGWNVLRGDVPLPACTLSGSAVDHNRRTMTRFIDEAGMTLAPHGKTTMAPQLFQEQLDDGAWGITAATPAHLFAYRAVGVPRIIYANQLIDRTAIAFVIDEMARDPSFEFISLVDSEAGALRLAREAERAGARPPLDVLIELGLSGRRCGVRTVEDGLALAETISRLTPWLRLRGVEAFEGVVPIAPESDEQVSMLLDRLTTLARAIQSRDQFAGRPILTVGGSAFFGRVADSLASASLDAELIMRSGCYLTSDNGMYAKAQEAQQGIGNFQLSAPFRPALEVWAHVQSRPEPDLVFLTLGKRDISHDIDLPMALKWVPDGTTSPIAVDQAFVVLWMNDQHLALRVPADHPIAVGDLFAVGCSHPCTTFDKWRRILVVDDSYDVVDVLATIF